MMTCSGQNVSAVLQCDGARMAFWEAGSRGRAGNKQEAMARHYRPLDSSPRDVTTLPNGIYKGWWENISRDQ